MCVREGAADPQVQQMLSGEVQSCNYTGSNLAIRILLSQVLTIAGWES